MVKLYTNAKNKHIELLFIMLVYYGNLNPNLRPCYNNSAIPGVLIANERPPSNTNILVELIRKFEDANPTLSPRELSLLIIQK